MSLCVVEDPHAYCSMCRQFEYVLHWTPERNYVAGTVVELRSHCMRSFAHWRYALIEMEGADVTFRWKIAPSVSQMRTNSERVILRARLPYGLRRGEQARIRLRVVPPIWAGLDNILSLWVVDVSNNFNPDQPAPEPRPEPGSSCALSVSPGPVERVSVYSRPMPGPDGKVRTVIVPEDRFGNPGAFAAEIPCELDWEGASRALAVRGPVTLKLDAPRDVGRARLSIPMDRLSVRENVANAVRDRGRLLLTGNPVWARSAGGGRAAFGEFHWHTEFSGDGHGPMREALRRAREDLNMDFVAPGDHNPRGADWDATVAALDENERPGEFSTFFGWENGGDRGHENYYFTSADHPLVCGGSAGLVSGRPAEVADQLRELYREHDFIAIPHHTNSVAETRKLEDDSPYWHPYPWGEPEDYIRLVEIFQVRGNQERDIYDDAWRGWHQGYGASAQQALRLGYRVGFVGGSDNHSGSPARAYVSCEGAGIHPPKSVILTGAWVSSLDRGGVYAALKARHTWAVWDTRALVEFRVNQAPAGDELRVPRGRELTAGIRLSAEDALQVVEIVSEGEVVWQAAFADPDIDIEVPLGAASCATHYYLRALQRDGGIIYASPVFVRFLADGEAGRELADYAKGANDET